MPHFPHTPEALLGRNDSKNPTRTCRGITSSGRACRRALASSKYALEEAFPVDFYCWQHKDQADHVLPLRGKTSIDTLVQKLGIDAPLKQQQKEQGSKRKETRPPRQTATNDFVHRRPTSNAPHAEKYSSSVPVTKERQRKKAGFWASLCCMTSGDDDEYVEIVRRRRRVEQTQSPSQPKHTSRPPMTQVPPGRATAALFTQHTESADSVSQPQTDHLLSLIPSTLQPQTTSALLAELVKPISPYDEDGYIYIFWLTPQSKSRPPDSIAQSLVPPQVARLQTDRRISDVMTEYSFEDDREEPGDRGRGEPRRNKTIMLKIGRANNITRRMNEWQRQCGYALNLVRWYPYVPSSSTPSPQPLYPDLSRPPTSRQQSETVHKCPHIHRVERLVHLELASKQVKRKCDSCGKEHREWFEVEATQAAVKAVDEVIRRWIAWAHT